MATSTTSVLLEESNLGTLLDDSLHASPETLNTLYRVTTATFCGSAGGSSVGPKMRKMLQLKFF